MPKPRTVREFSDSTFLDLLDDAAQALAGKNGRGPMSRELQGVFATLRQSLADGSALAARRPNARAAWRQLKKSPAWDEFDGLLREIYARGGIPYDAALKAAKGHAKLIGVKFGADELADLAGKWVDKHGAEFVVAIDRTTSRGMRDLIRGAYRLDSPGNRAKLGRSIRDHLLKNAAVGLTPHQMKGFLRDVERQIKSGRIATQKGIDRAWRKRVFQRSRFIAKNEGLINANAAQEAVIGEAVKTGRAEISGYDGVFTSRSGATETGPQAHVGCICGTRLVRIDGVLFVEWVTRSTSKHQYCIDFDGVLKGAGGEAAPEAAPPPEPAKGSERVMDFARSRGAEVQALRTAAKGAKKTADRNRGLLESTLKGSAEWQSLSTEIARRERNLRLLTGSQNVEEYKRIMELSRQRELIAPPAYIKRLAKQKDLDKAVGLANAEAIEAEHAFSRELRAALGEGREAQAINLKKTKGFREAHGSAYDLAVESLGKMWRRPLDGRPVSLQLGVRRAHYRDRHKKLKGGHAPKQRTGESFEDFARRRFEKRRQVIEAPPTIKLSKTSPVATLIHELGHWIEHHDPDVLRELVAFRARRTVGEIPVQMSHILRRHGYGRAEVTLPDKFLHPYMGKLYRRAGKDDASEILSMGLEWLWSQPSKLLEDEDYFEFIVKLILGETP